MTEPITRCEATRLIREAIARYRKAGYLRAEAEQMAKRLVFSCFEIKEEANVRH